MTLMDYFRLLFDKKNVIKLNIYQDDRRYKTVVRKPDGDKVDVDGKTYMIKHELVFFSGSVPTLNYLHNNPEPFNMVSGNVEGIVTPDEINATINNTVYKNMISDMLKGEKKLINMMLLMGAITILAVGASAYFLYDQLQQVLLFIDEQQDLIDGLRRALLEGVFN